MSSLALPTSPASVAVSSAAQLATPLPFRRDADDVPFPTAGAVMLVILLALAAWAWWKSKRGGVKPGRRALANWDWLKGGGVTPDDHETIHIVATARLDVHTRLHAVHWQGAQLLIAVCPGSPPVVLDRREPAAADRREVTI